MHAIWLTWKMHRFEVLFAVAVMTLLAVSSWIITQHLMGIPYPTDPAPGDVTPGPDLSLNAYWEARGGDAATVETAFKVLPLIIGLALGAPIVARELELRTAALAWSLTGRRQRWLAGRLVPMLLVGATGLLILGWLGGEFQVQMRGRGDMEQLGDLAFRGIPLASRGLAAFGLAMIAGAVLARTLPALLIAGVLSLGAAAIGSTTIPQAIAPPLAAWVPMSVSRAGGYSFVLDVAEFDTTVPGRPGEPGRRGEGLEERDFLRTCGAYPVGSDTEFERCAAAWVPSRDFSYDLTVARSALPVVEGVQVAFDMLVFGGAVIATSLVVARRRPA